MNYITFKQITIHRQLRGVFNGFLSSILDINYQFSYLYIMEISKSDLIEILFRFNPWWKGETIKDLSLWKRAIFNELFHWTNSPPVHRAVFLSGARQVGKTTLIRQTIQALLKENIPPSNILYATFDHPMIKLVGIDKIIEVWFEIEAPSGSIYLFIDEIQFMQDWQVWVKHQVDFNGRNRSRAHHNYAASGH